MRHNRLLIDFHVHLSQYDLLLDSPREWFLSCYPSEKNYLDLCEAYGNPDSFCELLKEKGVDYAVILAENMLLALQAISPLLIFAKDIPSSFLFAPLIP